MPGASWQIMAFLYAERKVTGGKLREFMLKLGPVKSKSTAENILRHLGRLSLIDIQVSGKNRYYCLTDCGGSLLADYNRRNPTRPVGNVEDYE